jgi:hypothetical protein
LGTAAARAEPSTHRPEADVTIVFHSAVRAIRSCEFKLMRIGFRGDIEEIRIDGDGNGSDSIYVEERPNPVSTLEHNALRKVFRLRIVRSGEHSVEVAANGCEIDVPSDIRLELGNWYR